MRLIQFIGCWLACLGLGSVCIAEPLEGGALKAVDAAVREAIDQDKIPGGVVWIERRGRSFHKAYGSRSFVPERETMTVDTIFDMASLTKVVATTPAIMILVERGDLSLEAPVQQFILFLSNRNHPTEHGSVGALRRTIGPLAAEAMGLTHSSNAPAAEPSAKSGNGP